MAETCFLAYNIGFYRAFVIPIKNMVLIDLILVSKINADLNPEYHI